MVQNDLMTNLILNLLAILVLLVFLGVLYAIIYAIFMFVFSWWDEAKIKKAWNSIRYSLLGFLLTLLILFAIPWFLRYIQVPWYKSYSSSAIFKTAKWWLFKVVSVFNQTTNSTSDPTTTDGNYSL